MAKYCSNCGSEVNETASYCLKCGKELNNNSRHYQETKNKNSFSIGRVILGVFVGLFLIGLWVGNGTSSNSSSSTRKENTNKIYNVGDTVTCRDFDVTLNSYQIKEQGEDVDDYSVVSDPEWVAVILTVKNTSDSEEHFYTSNVELQNSSGEILSSAFVTYKIWGVEMLKSPTLAPNGEKTGYIQFRNTDNDNSNLKLRIDCGSLFDDTVYTFNLN